MKAELRNGIVEAAAEEPPRRTREPPPEGYFLPDRLLPGHRLRLPDGMEARLVRAGGRRDGYDQPLFHLLYAKQAVTDRDGRAWRCPEIVGNDEWTRDTLQAAGAVLLSRTRGA